MPGPVFRRRVYTVETTDLERGSSYTTADLYLAAYLFASPGVKLIKTARLDRRVNFVFQSPDMIALRSQWDDGTGEVVASKYAAAVMNLKQLALRR